MSKNKQDMVLIKFLAFGKCAQSDEKIDLNKLFEAVVSCRSLEVNQNNFEEILGGDLNVDIKKLDDQLLDSLKEALMYYIFNWHGWKEFNNYSSGKLRYQNWFKKFRSWLVLNIHYVINIAPKTPKKDTNITTKDEATQTDRFNANGSKKTAPYTFCFQGPPHMLNTLVFTESNGHILLEQHSAEPWKKLYIKEFLNWPYVSVEVKLPDISFSRTSNPKYQRYISLSDDVTVFPKIQHINHITKEPGVSEEDLKPYTYEFIASYLKQLGEILRVLPDIPYGRLLELDAIFSEFLNDIKEANIYNTTMCTHVSVGYHISKSNYLRCKKMVNTHAEINQAHQNAISYYEIITPQVDFALNNFTAVQDLTDTEKITFQSLNKIHKSIDIKDDVNVNNLKYYIKNTSVIYSCKLCSKHFCGLYGLVGIMSHFNLTHKLEQPLLCAKCRKQYQLQVLTGQRWKHDCC